MQEFIQSLAKAELHIHIEGSLQPDLLLKLAKRNGISLPYSSVAQIEAAYNFSNLQSFLDLYYNGMQVLQTEEDYFDLMLAYLSHAHQQNIHYVEIFFDPQAHTGRGIAWQVFMSGFKRALNQAKQQFSVDGRLIMCFLRHLPEEEALITLEQALAYREDILGVGLDSSELGFPPRLFRQVFTRAADLGWHRVAHAGEEAPASYIWEALDILGVERIDHGNKAIDDPALIQRLATDKIPLTMCPLSNLRLKNVPDLREHQLKSLLDSGVMVTINSDDPAYFGGYLNENYLALATSLHLDQATLSQIAQNSFTASFN